ncbi:hypothetical protein BYT27DRAFT_7077822, partial [Phlegmacium glaucopus]
NTLRIAVHPPPTPIAFSARPSMLGFQDPFQDSICSCRPNSSALLPRSLPRVVLVVPPSPPGSLPHKLSCPYADRHASEE